MSATSTRVCFHCLSRWECDPPNGTDCPKCFLEGAFTCNLGDIGTAMMMETEGFKASDFVPFTKDQP